MSANMRDFDNVRLALEKGGFFGFGRPVQTKARLRRKKCKNANLFALTAGIDVPA